MSTQRSDVVDYDLDQLLIRWAKWAKGRHWEKHLLVRCQSIERNYLPPAGEVYSGIEDVLQASLAPEKHSRESDMVEIEKAVLRLPERLRTAVRLEWVTYKRLQLSAKRRILACTEGEYWLLVARGALTVRRVLTNQKIPVLLSNP